MRRGFLDIAEPDLGSACRIFERFTGAKVLGVTRTKGKLVGRLFKDGYGNKNAVQFKKDFCRQFGDHFPEIPHRGFGQFVSLQLLRRLKKLGIDCLVCVMPVGNGIVAYTSSVKKNLDLYEQYYTDDVHLKGEIGFPAFFLDYLFLSLHC